MTGIRIESKKGNAEFGVMSIPTRKSKFLYRKRGAMIEPLAYFRTDQNAEEFEKIIELLLELLLPRV